VQYNELAMAGKRKGPRILGHDSIGSDREFTVVDMMLILVALIIVFACCRGCLTHF
jgi:hypothetical protein